MPLFLGGPLHVDYFHAWDVDKNGKLTLEEVSFIFPHALFNPTVFLHLKNAVLLRWTCLVTLSVWLYFGDMLFRQFQPSNSQDFELMAKWNLIGRIQR